MPQAYDPLARSIWVALTTSHEHLALTDGLAKRYPAEVAPFAAIEQSTEAALRDLRDLLAPGESVYLMGDRPPAAAGLRHDAVVPCLQMLFPPDEAVPNEDHKANIDPLDCTHATVMLDLITLAYPGYFRSQTCRMGSYFGVRDAAQLVAMGGERLMLEADGRRWAEISGLCTHPLHTGKGYGTALLLHILRHQRAAGAQPWLHVVETNSRAIDLYHHLGFQSIRRVELRCVTRIG